MEAGVPLSDLTRRHADIAIRNIRPTHGDELVVRRLRAVPLGVYASAECLETIDDPSDPNAHRWLSWCEDMGSLPTSRWLDAVAPNAPITMRFNNATSMRLAAAAGAGAILIPKLFGDLTPSLHAVPLNVVVPEGAVYLVSHVAVMRIPQVQAVWRYLCEWLEDTPERNELSELEALHAIHYGISGRSTPKSSSS